MAHALPLPGTCSRSLTTRTNARAQAVEAEANADAARRVARHLPLAEFEVGPAVVGARMEGCAGVCIAAGRVDLADAVVGDMMDAELLPSQALDAALDRAREAARDAASERHLAALNRRAAQEMGLPSAA